MAAQLPLDDGVEEEMNVLEHPFTGELAKDEVLQHPFHIDTAPGDVDIERAESIDHTHSPVATLTLEATGKPELHRTASGYSIAASVIKVPRSRRAGLLGRLSLLYEAEDPKNYPRKIKWTITFIIAACAVAGPMGSAIILPALDEIIVDFDTTGTIANLTVALYLLSMSIFPLWWSSFSETAGRRTIYILSFTLYIIFNIVAAISNSIGMLIAMRMISGGAAAAVQAVGAGTVADVWEPKERGRAMGIFYLGPLCGPLIAPIIGGGLTEWLGWRSTQWFQVIYGGAILLLVIFCLPETLKTSKVLVAAEAESTEAAFHTTEKDTAAAMISSSNQTNLTRSTSRAPGSREYLALLRRILLDPFHIITYLRYPPIALTVYYASLCFGCLYFLNISVESTFSRPPYSFSTVEVGALYIFNSVGYLVASLAGGPWVDRIMKREARRANRYDARGRLVLRPEDRMRENAWCGAVLVPIALVWYGWCADRGVYFLAPMVANFFYGCGSMLIFGMATTMLTEFMPRRASNGVALNNFMRNIFSFGGTFLAQPLIDAIGNGWLFTILGVVAFLSLGVLVAMRRWCDKWRREMDEHMT